MILLNIIIIFLFVCLFVKSLMTFLMMSLCFQIPLSNFHSYHCKVMIKYLNMGHLWSIINYYIIKCFACYYSNIVLLFIAIVKNDLKTVFGWKQSLNHVIYKHVRYFTIALRFNAKAADTRASIECVDNCISCLQWAFTTQTCSVDAKI